MSKPYDIIIIGNNLQSAMLAFELGKSGIEMLLLSKGDIAENTGNEKFTIFKRYSVIKLYKQLKQNYLISRLKEAASHLLITTKIEEYISLNFFSRLAIHLNNLVSSQKIKVKKIPAKKGMFILSYNSYKISTRRLTIGLLKSIDRSHFSIVNYENLHILEWTTDEIYKLEYTARSTGKKQITYTHSILSTDFNIPNFNFKAHQFANAFEDVFYMTYPIDKLKFEKNIIVEHNNMILKIIPWFEWLYFELSGLNLKSYSVKKLNKLVKEYLPSIQLEKENILHYGTYKKFLNKKNQKATQTIYLFNNQEYNINYMPLKQWLNYSNTLIKKVLNWYGESEIEGPQLEKTSIEGSNFKIPYHPLRIMEFCDEKYDEAKQILKSPQYFKKLFYRYGTHIEIITHLAFENRNKSKNIQQAWLQAEIWYAVHYEFCSSAEDFINNCTEEWMKGKNTDIEFIRNTFKEILKAG